jgi:hypothetical protein
LHRGWISIPGSPLRGRPWLTTQTHHHTRHQLHPGVIIKNSYWRWPQRDLARNTIDFFVQVLGLTFPTQCAKSPQRNQLSGKKTAAGIAAMRRQPDYDLNPATRSISLRCQFREKCVTFTSSLS